jgi:hypothetical protein
MLPVSKQAPRRRINALHRVATPGPAPKIGASMRSKSTSRSVALSTGTLAEFHALAGHAGPADGCQECAAQLQRQRQTATALRTHQRQARQQVDVIFGGAVSA